MGDLVMLQWVLSAVVGGGVVAIIACVTDVVRLTLACRISDRRLAELEAR